MPEARGGSQEEQSLVQGAEAVRAQEGLEELLGTQDVQGEAHLPYPATLPPQTAQ